MATESPDLCKPIRDHGFISFCCIAVIMRSCDPGQPITNQIGLNYTALQSFSCL